MKRSINWPGSRILAVNEDIHARPAEEVTIEVKFKDQIWRYSMKPEEGCPLFAGGLISEEGEYDDIYYTSEPLTRNLFRDVRFVLVMQSQHYKAEMTVRDVE